MTAETAPQPERQVRAQGDSPRVRYWIVVAAVQYLLLHDRRFHVAVITGAIGAVALAELIKNNQARPVRRTASWYWEAANREPGRARRPARSPNGRAAGRLTAR
jgi:hypothetical protein